MSLGNTIYKARKKKNLTLKSLTKRIKRIDGKGISIGYVHNIERGIRYPSFKWLALISKTLNLDINKLKALAETDERKIKKVNLKNKIDKKYEKKIKKEDK